MAVAQWKPTPHQRRSLTFGRYQVVPHRRELLADGQPLKLGSRAYRRADGADRSARRRRQQRRADGARMAGPVCARRMPFQVQISALRAAFGPDRELIRTVSGRGYQFTGEINIRGHVRDGSR